MAPQDVFKTLPPELRAMALAGHYLQSFALMEESLNGVIGAALKLDGLQETIVCKNIQLRDKIKIARTLLSISFMSGPEKADYDKTLQRIGTASYDRNMVAHDLFMPSDRGHDGILFLVAKANGKLHYPETKWSVDETEEKSNELLTIGETLKRLKDAIKEADLLRSLVEKFKWPDGSEPSPIGKLFLQAGADQAAPAFRGLLDSIPPEPTDAKSPETPQEPQEK